MYSGSNPKKSKQNKDSSKYPQGYFKDKECRKCCKVFTPNAPSAHLCSDACKDHAAADRYLERNYGIDLDTYHIMLSEQDDKCAICGDEGFVMKKTGKVKLVIDHCHETGKVRGLLCHNCNRALGLLKDSRESIYNALEYLDDSLD